jgi:hypothetical protein
MPVTGNSPYGDTTHVDANTTRTVYKNKGQLTVIQISVVSRDRKARTVSAGSLSIASVWTNVVVGGGISAM